MNILTNPEAFFQEKINRNEDLTIPALIVLAAGIVGAVSAVMMAQISARMMPELTLIILLAAVAGILIGALIFWLFWSVLIYGISSVFAGEGSFRRTLEFVGYGFLPQVIGSAITVCAAFWYLPKIHVPMISSVQSGQGIQTATNAVMHDPAMVAFIQISSLLTIVFFLWSASIWISGMKHARKLSPRDAILCAGVPVVLYVIFLIYKIGA